jgi:starch synthase (maltosyl-transferring)
MCASVDCVIGRIVIDGVRPRTPTGYPAKGAVGDETSVSAEIFRDGHDILAARVRWRASGERKWRDASMVDTGNDQWAATITPDALGLHVFTVEAWTDRIATWWHDITIKHEAGQSIVLELEEGALLFGDAAARLPASDQDTIQAVVAVLRDATRSPGERLEATRASGAVERFATVPDPTDHTASAQMPLWVDRPRGMFSAWYELFPRSEGGLAGTRRRLAAIADMGFDVVYLPPIHPIGRTFRKGRGNTLEAGPDDPGSPWAIGSDDGGHTAVHPDLGSLADVGQLVEEAERLGMEVALDYALQVSPDHPWAREHPEWFHRRPDGTIKYAENPPKKYQDIYPINFWPPNDSDRIALWEACRDVLRFWIDHGIRIFRVDNPHTKPLAFWEWVIDEIRRNHPEVLFLAEAFTRPKMMAKLAEIGFTQSYTYFTWRTTKDELRAYVEEITHGPVADYMRPNFWPNTPDILSGPLRNGPPSAFALRFVLAATLVPSYGIYSGYELAENEPASELNEEYADSEKYEIKQRDWSRPGLTPLITRVNGVRRAHPCFARLSDIVFHHSNNPALLAYSRGRGDDAMLMVVNLDPVRPQEDQIWIDLTAMGLPADAPLTARDELTGITYSWQGGDQYIRLDPAVQVAHVLHLKERSV